MDSALRTGIYTLGKTVTGLDASNFFYGRASHAHPGSYCVFLGIDNPLSFDSGYLHEMNYVQFKFYGEVLATIETLVTNFITVFDFGRSSLSVSGYNVIQVVRIRRRPPRLFGKIWQVDLEYRIEIQKARS